MHCHKLIICNIEFINSLCFIIRCDVFTCDSCLFRPEYVDQIPSCRCVILSRNGTASVVTSIFGGILQNEVNCLICGTESRKFDPFLGEGVEDGFSVFSVVCDQARTGSMCLLVFHGSPLCVC